MKHRKPVDIFHFRIQFKRPRDALGRGPTRRGCGLCRPGSKKRDPEDRAYCDTDRSSPHSAKVIPKQCTHKSPSILIILIFARIRDVLNWGKGPNDQITLAFGWISTTADQKSLMTALATAGAVSRIR